MLSRTSIFKEHNFFTKGFKRSIVSSFKMVAWVGFEFLTDSTCKKVVHLAGFNTGWTDTALR